MLQQNAAVPWSEPDPEPFRCLAVKTSFAQKLPSHDGVWAAQLLDEELRRQPQRLRHADARTRLRPGASIVGVAQLNAHAIGEPFDCLHKREVVDLAHEVDDVATFGAGTKAVPIPA